MNQPPPSKWPESRAYRQCRWAKTLMFPDFPVKMSNVSICPHWREQGQDVVAPCWQSLLLLWLKTATHCCIHHFNSSQPCAWVSLISALCHWLFTWLGCQWFLWMVWTKKLGVQWYIVAKGSLNWKIGLTWGLRLEQSCSCNVRSQWPDF